MPTDTAPSPVTRYVAPIQIHPNSICTIKDACHFFRCSRAHFYTIAKRYGLKVHKDGKDSRARVRIKGSDLLAVQKKIFGA